MAKALGGLDLPINESQGGTNATTFNQARTNMGLNPLISAQTLTYNVVVGDRGKFIHYTGAGGVDLTLDPAATLGNGFNFTLRNDAAANITINPNGGELIDGAATLAVAPGQAVIVICTGAEFYTIGQAAAAAVGANTALSNLAAVAFNEDLIPDADASRDVGSQANRIDNLYVRRVQTGDTAADTLEIGAWDVDGAVFVPFFTTTAGNTPTGVIASAVTGTTQAPNTNNTQLATCAYADAVAVSGGGQVLLASASGGGATIDFANFLSATYDNYELVVEGLLPATNATTLQLRVGTGAGPTYQATSYSGNIYSNVGGTTFASGTTAIDCNPQNRMSNTASRVSRFHFSIGNVNAGTDKSVVALGGYWDSTASADANTIVTGRWQSATVITSLRLLMSSGNINGTVKLYGLKN